MSAETFKTRVKAVMAPLLETIEGGAEMQFPTPVWGKNEDKLTGIIIRARKQMADVLCDIEAAFTLTQADLRDEALIRAKGEIAVGAIRNTITVKMRPVANLKDVG